MEPYVLRTKDEDCKYIKLNVFVLLFLLGT